VKENVFLGKNVWQVGQTVKVSGKM